MTNTIKNTSNALERAVERVGQIAIYGVLLALLVGIVFAVVNAQGDDNNAKPAKEPNIKIAGVDNTTNDDDCIKENYWVYEYGKWTEKEIIYPWSKCFDLKNSEKFDGFAYENAEKLNVEEFKKEAKEKLLSLEINKMKEQERILNISALIKRIKETNNFIEGMNEKEIFRFVFREVVVEDVAKKIENLDSYGGLAVDEDGGLIFVYLNDDKDKKKIKEILKPHINKGANVVFLKGKYTEKQLLEQKKNIREINISNVATLTASLSLNGIIIGLREINNETLNDIYTYLNIMKIPVNNIYIEKATDCEEFSRNAKYRPLFGGIKITLGNGACTQGFVARHSGESGVITAGHCGSTNVNVYQPASPDYIGKVSINSFSNNPGYVYADVAWIPTTLEICSKMYENYEVIGKIDYGGWIGEQVCKGGIRTGETCGRVVERHKDCLPSDSWVWRYDQTIASFYIYRGDSGAAVYKKYESCGEIKVKICGVAWGTCPQWSGSGYAGAYSSISNVEKYTGSLSVSDIGWCL